MTRRAGDRTATMVRIARHAPGGGGGVTTPVDVSRPFRGRVFRYGDHVNTDVIFPGRYTYTKSRPEEVAPHALEDLDPTFAERVRLGDVIVAGWNWGCGSSREQAAVCLRCAGVGAVIARSFGRIFYRNALNNGLLAIVCPEAVDALEEDAEVEVDLDESTIRCFGDPGSASAASAPGNAGSLPGAGSRGVTFGFAPFSPAVRAMIAAGGLIEQTKRRLAAAPGGTPGKARILSASGG